MTLTTEQISEVCSRLDIEIPVRNNEVNRRKLLTENIVIDIDNSFSKLLFGDAYAAYVLYSVYAAEGMNSLSRLIDDTKALYVKKFTGLNILKTRKFEIPYNLTIGTHMVPNTVVCGKINVNKGELSHVYTNKLNTYLKEMVYINIPTSYFFKKDYANMPTKFIMVDKIIGKINVDELKFIDYLSFISQMMMVDDDGNVYRVIIEDPVDREENGYKFLDYLFEGWNDLYRDREKLSDVDSMIRIPDKIARKYGTNDLYVTYENRVMKSISTPLVRKFISNLNKQKEVNKDVEVKVTKKKECNRCKKHNSFNYKLVNKILKDELREELSSFVTTMNIVSTEYDIIYKVDKENNLLYAVATSKTAKKGELKDGRKIIYKEVDEYECKFNNITELIYLCRELGIKEV